MTEPVYGAIEGGGTKFVCAVGHSPERTLDRVVLPTREPRQTLMEILEFFTATQSRHGSIRAFGIASFGPLDLKPDSPTYGRLLASPKPGWSGTDLLDPLRSRFGVPVRIETDVAAAALAEWRLGAGRDVGSIAYITVGTGIGGDFAPAVWNRATLLHAEMGHLRVTRDPRDLHFPGTCPFHHDCLEGLASGPAIRARWGAEMSELDSGHLAWPVIGNYLGQLAASIALMASPQRLVFGGGVLTGGRLLPHVRASTGQYLNRYLTPLNETGALDRYIVAPGLGDGAGVAGAFLLAAQAGHEPL